MINQKVFIVQCFVCVTTILSEIPPILDEQMWVTNGAVNVLVSTENKLFLGGGFTYIGPCTGGGAVVDSIEGRIHPEFPKVSIYCYAVEPDGKGGWYIGGLLIRVGNVTRENLAHILPDNTIDTSWNPQADNIVYSLSLCDTKLYVGGQFTSINGESRNRIACLDAATGALTEWNPNARWSERSTGCCVNAVVARDSLVYVGGAFDSIGGEMRRHVACLDTATGRATDWNPAGANNKVHALFSHGKYLYMGGAFTSVGNKSRGRIARLELNTGVVTDWNPGANFNQSAADCCIYSIVADGNMVYAAGEFDYIGGESRRSIACLDSGTGQATSWESDANKMVYSLSLKGNRLYAGGEFDSIGGVERNFAACLDAETGTPTNWNPSGSHTVYSVAAYGNVVFIAGKGTAMNAVKRRGLACIDKKSKKATAWNPDVNGIVDAITVAGGKVYVGGPFDTIGGVNRNHIACVDTLSGTVTDWNPEVQWYYSHVDAIVVNRGKVYFGGSFRSVGGQPQQHLAACDTVTGALTDWDPNPDERISALLIIGGKVYAGGSFSSIGGESRNGLACLDTATGVALSWNPNIDGTVRTMTISGEKMYVSGGITHLTTGEQTSAARIDIGSGEADEWNPNPGGTGGIKAIAPHHSDVYLGGSFLTLQGVDRFNLGSVDANTAAVSAWDPQAGAGTINSIIIDTFGVNVTDVYVGGSFYTMCDRPQFNVTHFYTDRTRLRSKSPQAPIEHQCNPTITISNHQCDVRYSLTNNSRVLIAIYDLYGKNISIAVNKLQPIGDYSTSVATTSLSPGLYLLRIRLNKFEKMLSFTIVR